MALEFRADGTGKQDILGIVSHFNYKFDGGDLVPVVYPYRTRRPKVAEQRGRARPESTVVPAIRCASRISAARRIEARPVFTAKPVDLANLRYNEAGTAAKKRENAMSALITASSNSIVTLPEKLNEESGCTTPNRLMRESSPALPTANSLSSPTIGTRSHGAFGKRSLIPQSVFASSSAATTASPRRFGILYAPSLRRQRQQIHR